MRIREQRSARWLGLVVVLAFCAGAASPNNTTPSKPNIAEKTQPRQGPATPPKTPSARLTWTSPLPAAAGDKPVLVVLSPHPDDETLSFGVQIANTEARGERVIIVALTDGRDTGAVTAVSSRLHRTVSQDEIAAARLRELSQAATFLGVAPADVYPAHLDGETTLGGSRLTPDEVTAVIRVFAERFPQATFATMSWVAERHPDHLAAGRALEDAAKAGLVHQVEFAVSRLWWKLPSPTENDVLPVSNAGRRRVIAAAQAYRKWDPAQHRYSIGWFSVHGQFLSLVADPRNRLHGTGPVRPATP